MTEIGLVEKMTAACSGSLLTSVVVNPFDVIRVRMQQDSAFASASRTAAKLPSGKFPTPATFDPALLRQATAGAQAQAHMPSGIGTVVCCRDVFWYPSTIDYCVASQIVDSCTLKENKAPTTFRLFGSIFREEGPRALWRGLALQLFQSVPSNVVYFVAYEALRDNSPIASSFLNPLVCGGVSRLFATTVTSPIELFKTRLQSVRVQNPYTVVMASIRDMVKQAGPMSLWSGLTLTLWRDVPFSMVYWLVVEAVRDRLAASSDNSTRSTFIQSAVAGTTGGVIASVLTTPFDVGKTRKQLGHTGTESASMRMLSFMAHIIREEGWRALFVGMTPRMLKVAPACAIMITSYEMSKIAFASRPRQP